MNKNDKKKIIGTILGVIFFAALIAGATFAWLTFSATISNGNYNVNTYNFIVNYSKGTDITNVPTLPNGTPEEATHLIVGAKLGNSNVPGKITIKLTTTVHNLLTKSQAVNWVVCQGDSNTQSPCTSNFQLQKSSGQIKTTGPDSEITLYADNNTLTTTYKYYWIYFWVDPSKITNDMLTNNKGQYSGYIHASAEQQPISS